MCSHVVENFGKILDEVEYVQTFKALKTRYDQLKDRDRGGILDGYVFIHNVLHTILFIDINIIIVVNFDFFTNFRVPSILRNSRYHRDQRQLEEEEEMWFNEEEEFEDGGDSVVPAHKIDTDLDSLGK